MMIQESLLTASRQLLVEYSFCSDGGARTRFQNDMETDMNSKDDCRNLPLAGTPIALSLTGRRYE